MEQSGRDARGPREEVDLTHIKHFDIREPSGSMARGSHNLSPTN